MNDVRLLKIITYLSILTAVLLIVGALNLPYHYYTLLRVEVFAASLFTLGSIRKTLSPENTILLLISTILFNPVFKVFLFKGLWMFIDLSASALFAKIAFENRKAYLRPNAKDKSVNY